MSRKSHVALVTPLLGLAATPVAAATLPRPTGSLLDYFLMPFLGYLALVAIPWSFSLILRLKGSRA